MILAVVQARIGSKRFPGKVLEPVMGVPLIELLLSRLQGSKRINSVVLATSDLPANDGLAAHVSTLGIEVFRGSEADVLDRYRQVSRRHAPQAVVRITGDCPLIDPQLVDQIIEARQTQGVDYMSNTLRPTFPHGLDAEVFTLQALDRTALEASDAYDREHVTPFMYRSGLFTLGNFVNRDDLSSERWTVDEPEDLEVVRGIVSHFHPRIDFSWGEVMALRLERPDLFRPNLHLKRHEDAHVGMGRPPVECCAGD